MQDILLKKDYSESTSDFIKDRDIIDLPDFLKTLDQKDRKEEEIIKINRYIFGSMILAQDNDGQLTVENKDGKIYVSLIL